MINRNPILKMNFYEFWEVGITKNCELTKLSISCSVPYDNIKVRRGRILSPFDYFLVLNNVKAVSSVEVERDFL